MVHVCAEMSLYKQRVVFLSISGNELNFHDLCIYISFGKIKISFLIVTINETNETIYPLSSIFNHHRTLTWGRSGSMTSTTVIRWRKDFFLNCHNETNENIYPLSSIFIHHRTLTWGWSGPMTSTTAIRWS